MTEAAVTPAADNSDTAELLAGHFHLHPSYGVDGETDRYERRREEVTDSRQLMFAAVPQPMAEVGSGPSAHRSYLLTGVRRHAAARPAAVWMGDVRWRRQPTLLIPPLSPRGGAGAGLPGTAMMAIECPTSRRYWFDSMANVRDSRELTEEDRTYAKNPDGTPVTEGCFYTTDNRSPGRIFVATRPRFVPGRALPADGSEAGYEIVPTCGLGGGPINLANIFYQCSNLRCGRRVAAEMTFGCGKCGCVSTTRYCSVECQWTDADHWRICGWLPLLEGNVVPATDPQRVISSKQTYRAPNVDAWRQQVSHATSPGSYTLFLLVSDGFGPPYRDTYQVAFPPGWEGNCFAFLTRLAVDRGHVGAVRLCGR
ncbi:hypothetical protein DRE_03175 [Drechslerella stenobrocha 248]|uniref:Uncharacterized protein n=1 Tax=Drechslerella stenobrocha 248 TaxID=1043628 RepID=W7IEW1_9PEZI|nr:hypothetical protein DRE_03175 [Drechslerella stenobrocha 248]